MQINTQFEIYFHVEIKGKKYLRIAKKLIEKTNWTKILYVNNQRIEPIEEKIFTIYIPILNNEIIYKSNSIPNYSCIDNVKQVYNFINNILPKENDIIFNNNLFIAVINIDIASELD